ncbi:DUF3820 family protein [uncultured Megamonas sp.]|uniref:DUF3820 family protein n=1 Tax=uncultured Megamonas sp. TaxID=286140 RepID=UPI00259B9675|nr:DUF3820 family protein [uncultured Megamonas sp.]
MEDNLKIYNMIKKVPDEAQKKITGGRLSGMTDIKPMWRIEKLTEVFGPCGLGWYTTTRNKEIIDGANGEKIAVVDINLFVNYKKPFGLDEDLWSEPIEGTGGSSFIANERNGLYTSDECFKMAYTDALSVSCKSLGMGAEIYWGDSKYVKQETIETVEQAKEYVLNFGKHKGKKLSEIPDDYLSWLYNSEKTGEVIKKAINLLNQDRTDKSKQLEEPFSDMPIQEGQKQWLKMNLTEEEIKKAIVNFGHKKLSELNFAEAEKLREFKEKQQAIQHKQESEVF